MGMARTTSSNSAASPNNNNLTSSGAAAQPVTKINFEVPRGACDCLTHIYGDLEQFPMAPGRTYTPELASIPEIEQLHRALHVDRVIIVQPTIYGTDNACTLDAIKRLGSNARGIAVVDDNVSQSELDVMDAGGIRGVRINLETVGLTNPAVARERLKVAIDQVRDRPGWHIQIYTRPSVIEATYDLLSSCPVPIAFDHFAGIRGATGAEQPGFALLLNLLQSGKAYVKLSAPYLASQQGPDYPDIVSLAKRFIAVNPENILWGTNWPHPNSGRVEGQKNTDISPLRDVDDGHILNLLPTWAPDPAHRRAILVDNPARLYGF